MKWKFGLLPVLRRKKKLHDDGIERKKKDNIMGE